MINSITAEKERYEAVLPLVLKYKAKVIALCIDDKGLPEAAKDRIPVARWLVENLTSAGVSKDDIYLDPLDKVLMGFFYASRALLGQDQFCKEYLSAHRGGLYK